MADANRLGVVRWLDDDVPREAELFDDGAWRSSDAPEVARRLTAFFGGGSYGGPSDGPFGPAQLAAAARSVGGTFEADPAEVAPPGVAY